MTNIIPPTETISTNEAAEILGVSRSTVILWYNQKKLPGYKLGDRTSKIRLYRDHVLAFLKARQEAP